jgi:hypothetical protein
VQQSRQASDARPFSMPVAEPGTAIVKMASFNAELSADLRAAGPASRPHRSEVSKHALPRLGRDVPRTAPLLNGKTSPQPFGRFRMSSPALVNAELYGDERHGSVGTEISDNLVTQLLFAAPETPKIVL